jgi:short-subunit dehydrogenase
MTEIAGRIVLLTGASRGLGACIARSLALAGAQVVGVARSPDALEQVGKTIQQEGGRWFPVPWDVSRLEELPRLVQHVSASVGSVDILINNAGIEIYRPFPDYTTADLRMVLTTNLLAAMELTRLLLPEMLHRGGHIVNMASLAADHAPAFNSVYAASKAGLLKWSDALRQELHATGVRVSVICPGYVTELGMTADSGVPVPSLVGVSSPERVVRAVLDAITQNRVRVLVNQDLLTEIGTTALFMLNHAAPQMVDAFNRWSGLVAANLQRAQQTATPPTQNDQLPSKEESS